MTHYINEQAQEALEMRSDQASKFGRVQILKNFENLSIWGFRGVFGGIWICNTDTSRKFGFL